MTETATVTSTPSTTVASPSSRTRRASTLSPAEELFNETIRWRRVAVWRFARWTPDAHAVTNAAVWEAIVEGETEHVALYAAARRALVRARRHEVRHSRQNERATIDLDRSDASWFAVERVDAEVAVRKITESVGAPSPATLEWVDRKTGASCGDRLSSTVKSAGARWASRVRAEFGDHDEAV